MNCFESSKQHNDFYKLSNKIKVQSWIFLILLKNITLFCSGYNGFIPEIILTYKKKTKKTNKQTILNFLKTKLLTPRFVKKTFFWRFFKHNAFLTQTEIMV